MTIPTPSRRWSNIVVTLMHGTFACKATWVNADGRIARALKARFGDAVTTECIRWSGANTFGARRTATDLLRTHLLGPWPGREDAGHVVVAHSHAGNIVAYAARDPAVDAKLAGIVTLATPFIVARERNLGWAGMLVSQSLVIWLVLGLFWLAQSWHAQRAGWGADGQFATAYKIALIVALVVLIEIPGLLLTRAWRRSSRRLLEEVALAPIARERILILRAMADEATGVITFLRLPSALATVAFGWFAGLTDAYVRWCARLVQRRWVAVVAFLPMWVISGLPALLIGWWTGSELLMWVVLIAATGFSYGPVVFLWLRRPDLALIVAAAGLAIPLAPALVIIAIAAAIAYGPRFALANLDLDISVESTPVGEYLLTLLSPSAAADPDHPGGLLHSALYEDERAIGLIGDFIAVRLGPGSDNGS